MAKRDTTAVSGVNVVVRKWRIPIISSVTVAAAASLAFLLIPGSFHAGGSVRSVHAMAAPANPAEATGPTFGPHVPAANPGFFPPAGVPSSALMPVTAAVFAARSEAVAADGIRLSSSAAAALPVYTRLMSYSRAVALIKDSPDPRVDGHRPVWVVTVIGRHPMDTLPFAKATFASRYTILFDAASGFQLVDAIGFAALSR